MSILQGINKRKFTTGGISKAFIAKISDLEITFTDGDGATPSTAAFALSGGTPITPANTPFRAYAFTQDSSNGSSPATGTAATGTMTFAHTVNLTFHKRDAAIRNEIQVLADNETVIILQNCEGYAELYGGKCNKGLMLTTGDAQTGTVGSDLNGYVLTFSQSSQPTLPYTVEQTELDKIDPDNA